MEIEKLNARNFKIFEELDLDLQGKSTVIFGINGTGKSTILAIINYLFRVWINRLNPSQGKAYGDFNSDIVRIGASECTISATVKMDDSPHKLVRQYRRQKSGMPKKQQTYDKKLYDVFCEDFERSFLEPEYSAMPIFVNYGTNRSVLDIPLRIRSKHEFSIISALERSIENELDFRTFFEWFRNQEDLENELKLEMDNSAYEDRMLSCVRRAIESMLGDVEGLKVRRNPLCMKVKKGGRDIRVDQLSDGEKCTLALVGDLARRIAIVSQHRENPLEGTGIVLIDEIELHMHPGWQRRVLGVLANTFPNIQFIVTTHSPQVLGEADDRYRIICLSQQETGSTLKIVERMDGFDSNYILEEYMNTTSKNQKVKDLIRLINMSILEKDFKEAESRINVLKEIAGDTDQEVILAEGYLRRRKGEQ